MNRVKALAADAALYPVWIAFLILFLIWRIRVRVAASPPASTTDAWLDAADHEHQRRGTPVAAKPAYTPFEVIRGIAAVADVIGWQAGVGGSETAGAIVSYLAKHPELVEPFFAGDISPVDFGANWLHEGCLSWQGSDGKVWTPDKAREARAARAATIGNSA